MHAASAAPGSSTSPHPRTPGRRSAKLLTGLALVAGVLVAACTATAAPTAAPTATPAPATPAPIVLTDDEGTAVTLPAPAQRIVSLSPAITETLFALGAGGQVVGGTEADDYPEEAKALPDVASFTGVNVEAVVAARPDVVIAGGMGLTPPADIEKLRSLGIPVAVVYADSVDGVLSDIALVGRAAGVDSAADDLDASLRQRIDEVSGAAKAAGTKPRVFYELDATKEIYGPAPDSFLAEMIELAGGEPITSGDPNVWAISLERLVSADPEVIILGDANYGMTPDAVASRPGWAGMTAVKQGAIHAIDDTVVTRPGPRIVAGLEALVKAIHADLVLP